MVFHGDFSCDGSVDAEDIDLFFKCLGGFGECSCGFSITPEFVADLIETHVHPSRIYGVVDLLTDYAATGRRVDRRWFWAEVVTLLTRS